jgi:YVTN family beta-propeller protein
MAGRGWRILTRLLILLAVAGGATGAEVPAHPVAADSPGLLLVVNQAEHTLLIVDPRSKREIGRTVVGVNGHEVTVSKDGRLAYVPIYSNVAIGEPGTDGDHIDVVDLQTRKVAASVNLGKPVRPHRALLGTDGLLYVTAELDNAVDVVDPATLQVVSQIPTGQPQTHMLVLAPNGDRAYTANVSAGSVSVLDLKKRKLITVIPVAKTVQRISISPDGGRVFTQDRETARVAVIDTATNKISRWIEMPELPFASAPTPDGRWLLVTTNAKDQHRLHVVDLKSLKITRSFELPDIPLGILIQPDGNFAYATCVRAGKIAVLNLRSWQMEEPIVLTRGVDGMAWTAAVQ